MLQPEMNDGSVEQRSLCLALIRQTLSGNEPNLSILMRDWGDSVTQFPNKNHGGFYYKDWIEDNWQYTSKMAINIPDWPCLNLKPEILEKAIINCLRQHSLEYLKQVLHKTLVYWFVFIGTEDSDYWFRVHEDLKCFKQGSIESTYEQPLKIQKDEIEFQRKKGGILRGTVPEGNQQSSGKCKTATCIGHLSHQICSGR